MLKSSILEDVVSGDQVWNQAGQQERLGAKNSPILEVILALFPYLLQVFF